MLQKLIEKFSQPDNENLLELMNKLHSELNQLQIEEIKENKIGSNYDLKNNRIRQYQIIDKLNLYQSKLPSEHKFTPSYI